MSTRKTRKVKEYFGITIRLAYWIVIMLIMRENSLLKNTAPEKNVRCLDLNRQILFIVYDWILIALILFRP